MQAMRQRIPRFIVLLCAVGVGDTADSLAQGNPNVRFSLVTPAAYADVGPREVVEVALAATDIDAASQVEIVLGLDPAEAFDLTASAFSSLGSPFDFAPGLDLLGEGAVRGGGASLGATVSGNGLLGTFRLVTSDQFTSKTPARITVDLISIGLSVTERDQFPREELDLEIRINPDAPPVTEPYLRPIAAQDVSATFSPVGRGAAVDGSAGEVTLRASLTDADGEAAVGRSVEWSITSGGPEAVHAMAGPTDAQQVSAARVLTTFTDTDGDGFAEIVLDAEGDARAAPTSVTVVATARAANSQGVNRVLTLVFALTWDLPVPAELASLSLVRLDEHRVRLSWSVSSQTSNLGWEVYRQTGEADFQQVRGLIPGGGTSDEHLTYEIVDTLAAAATHVHRYRLRQIDLDGSARYSRTVQIVVGPTATASPAIPDEPTLHQNYPNPFNARTTIVYELAVPSPVSLVVYDALGRMIKRLERSGIQSPGRHTSHWDGKDMRGHRVSSGVYFVTLRGAPFEQTRKMVLAE